MTEGAQQTIPIDIPLHPLRVWPPHCPFMLGPPVRPPRGNTWGGNGSRLEEANAQLKDANEQLKGANDELKEKITELTAENGRMALEIERLKMEKDHLNEMLAREQDLSRERWARLEAADRRIDSLMDKIPPMLPPASIESSSGGGLFGWLRKKKA